VVVVVVVVVVALVVVGALVVNDVLDPTKFHNNYHMTLI